MTAITILKEKIKAKPIIQRTETESGIFLIKWFAPRRIVKALRFMGREFPKFAVME